MNVSWDGELVVACTTDPLLDRANGQALLFDPQGNLLHSTDIGGGPSARPAISPDNRYVAIPLRSGTNRSLVMLDGETGDLVRTFHDEWVNMTTFDPSGSYLGLVGAPTGVSIIDLEGSEDRWGLREVRASSEEIFYGSVSLCKDASLRSIFALTRRPRYPFFSLLTVNGEEVYRTQASNLDLSPNGKFGFSFNTRRAHPTDYEPSLVEILSIRERG
jgi:hypothetical protein